MATPPSAVLRTMPSLPEWKRHALEVIEYGPIIVVSLFFPREIPWTRVYGLISSGTIYQGVFEATFERTKDSTEDAPTIFNFFISTPPDEKTFIAHLAEQSDEDIVASVLADFSRTVPGAQDAGRVLTSSKVTRFVPGEMELTPQYYLEALPHVAKPVGNVHFVGDYTDPFNFVDGACVSGIRCAAELGSSFVKEEEIIRFPHVPRYGGYGWLALVVSFAMVVFGLLVLMSGQSIGVGATAFTAGALLLALTALYPSFLPPMDVAYQGFLGLSVVLCTILVLIWVF
eukprot:gnl/Dysnectes_brevis/1886_a2168_1339.p1 GENE.gnl/Dysnectes_brevis/1886_a2168_1339~~gnl/Dysnectes_brevis/1886_a2168_1339.p1  ORF type:complete len:286 (-),score=74.84 gnl/Dysnectes_brevis/1886_a2168_1339:123-980(-)